MRKFAVLLVLLLAPAFAQSVQVSVGSAFGVNAGVTFPLVPLLVEGRVYGGYNIFRGGIGGGVDALVSVPLTDLYAGGGLFFGNNGTLSAIGSGNFGARGVIGTYLNVGLPLIGIFVEAHPMVFFGGSSTFGLGGAIGVNVGF